jgi:uncharacterized membrane protein HdeD (DUF308 family)
MTDKINLDKMQKNANKLLNEDGLVELLMGAILFITSSTFSSSSAFTPFLGIYVIFMRSIIESFRKRFTYPRIGYLKLQDDDIKQVGWGILTFVGAIMLGLVIFIYLIFGGVTSSLFYNYLPIIMALILFGGLYYNYQKTYDKTNLIYIIIALAASIIFTLLQFNSPKDGPQLYLLMMSGVFIASGAIRLYSFTQRYPVIDDERGLDDE